MKDEVIVLDFGAQYAQLIARRVREHGVYAEILPWTTPVAEILSREPGAIILSGGPESVYAPSAPAPDPALLESRIPMLGICYGMQWIARELGGRVVPGKPEYGPAEVRQETVDPLLVGVPERFTAWMSHGDRVETLPEGFSRLLSSDGAPNAAIGDARRGIYAVQFHPEVVHTQHGREIIRNFLFEVAGLSGGWDMGSFIEREVPAIRDRVGDGKALVALSGGVDSAVAAAIVQRAIGDRLTAVFVDHGLMRAGEGDEVEQAFTETFPVHFVHVRAQERFVTALAGVTDPEVKRKTIGELFVRVFEEEAARLGQVDFLVQGTLYPDVIESGPGSASVIKSHHNVGGLPKDLRFKLLEPLRELFKDEVRALGDELGLPESLVRRQPFPGPGLAIRIVGEVTAPRLELLRHADLVVRREIAASGLERDMWQWFAVLPGVQSVGVMGDHRTYQEAVVVRAVTSDDGMTADWARLPHDVLQRIASAVVSEVAGVNRVLYDITSKPPGTIEWE